MFFLIRFAFVLATLVRIRTAFAQDFPPWTICTTSNSSFNDFCQLRNGVVVQSHCFFVATDIGSESSNDADWANVMRPGGGYNNQLDSDMASFNTAATDFENAWKVCATRGATLSQIQTYREFAAVSDHFYGRSLPWWVALKRMPDTNGQMSESSMNNIYWCDSATQCNTLSASNSYIRKATFQTLGSGNYCFIQDGQTLIATDCGSTSNPPLCQITNAYQRFAYTGGICMTAGIILLTDITSEQECADLCISTPSCRGFNIVVGGTKCQLTSWRDDDEPSLQIPRKDCYYFKEP